MSKSKKGATAPQTDEQDKPDPAILTGPAGCGSTAQAQRLAQVMGLEIKPLDGVADLERGVLHVTSEHPDLVMMFADDHVPIIPFKHALRTAAEIELRRGLDAAVERGDLTQYYPPRRHVGRNAAMFISRRGESPASSEGLRA